MFFKIIFILLFHATKCSVVIDSLSQRGVHISDFCPKMKYCAEGSHVMCQYYNPEQLMGPRCSNPKNVSITPEIAKKLLDVSNAVRSKLALGKEKGKGGHYLPRSYGMFKLKWDNELATFAQVWANQCTLGFDTCRATNRFPNPAQSASLVRFTVPDWYAIVPTTHFTTPGLNAQKLMYAATRAIESWYLQKNFVTTEMIMSYPDWTENPNNRFGMMYLHMIYGPATHMGCGVSAYTDYGYIDKPTTLNFNFVQFVCNFSAKPRKQTRVYNTTAPKSPEFSSRCGCPPGSYEDYYDCLCVEEDIHQTQQFRKCPNGVCDPTVVLLPIISVEDAPPEKLISKTRKSKTSDVHHNSMEFIDIFDATEKHDVTQNFRGKFLSNNNRYQNTATVWKLKANELPRASKKRILDVKNRRFDGKQQLTVQRYQRTPSFGTLTDHGVYKKQSIFSRQAKFMLPINGNSHLNTPSTILRATNKIIKDVPPRKDFTEVQKLVDSYLGKTKHFDPFHNKNQLLTHKYNYDVLLPNHETHFNNLHGHGTETVLHTAEDRVIDFNRYVTNQNLTPVIHRKEAENSDAKLMYLLDTLEKEVKNIELHGSEKQIFDTKIRKIYGKVLGKHDDLMNSKQINPNHEYDSSKEIQQDYYRNNEKYDHNSNKNINELKMDKRLQELDNFNIYEKHTNFADNTELHTRNQNYIDDERNNNIRGTKLISSYEDLNSYDRYNNDLKTRKTYTRGFDAKFNKKHLEDLPKRGIKKQQIWDITEDPLSTERRKYYQNKLENLERRLQNTHSYKHRNRVENDRQVRRMRPTGDYHTRRVASKKQIDPFYMPERARFLHGFRR